VPRTATLPMSDAVVTLPDPRSAETVRSIFRSNPWSILARLNILVDDIRYRKANGQTNRAYATSDLSFAELTNEAVATCRALESALDDL
jgi:hypothetical protein